MSECEHEWSLSGCSCIWCGVDNDQPANPRHTTKCQARDGKLLCEKFVHHPEPEHENKTHGHKWTEE